MSHQAVYRILKDFDELYKRGEFASVDCIISNIDIENTSTDLLVAYATATSPAKDKLKNRAEMFNKIDAELRSRDDWDPTHLSGLE